MGNMDNFFGTGAKAATSRAGELCIAATAEKITALKLSTAMGSLGPAEFVAVEPGAEVPEALLANARVLVLEVDSNQSATLRRIRDIRSEHPDLKIIAAIARADVSLVKTLVRQGICDVAELPFQAEELAAQILDACSADAADQADLPLAPLYAVVRSVGGSGSTSVLTHLAAALVQAAPAGSSVCVADLDLQGGEVAAYVGLPAPVTVAALIEAGDRLDDDLVNSTILDLVGVDQINTVLTSLRHRFAYVLVDLPADWTNWSLSIAASAKAVLMVTDSSIAGLRQGRRKIDLLESVGVERTAVKLIANRTERRLFRNVGTEDIAEALRAEVVATLGDEGGNLRAAQDQGALLTDTVGKNGYTKSIDALARQLAAGEL
jgi:pilus assembly protein CpaE